MGIKHCVICGKSFFCTEEYWDGCRYKDRCWCYQCYIEFEKSHTKERKIWMSEVCYGKKREEVLIDLMVIKIESKKEET